MNSLPSRLAGTMLIASTTAAAAMVAFFQFITPAMIGR